MARHNFHKDKLPEEAKPEANVEFYLISGFSDILPVIKDQGTIKTIIGIMPLLRLGTTDAGREISRDFESYESPKNFLSVVGGKLTTARLRGEKISDWICKKESSSKRCKTHLKELPPN
ncbi:MAG: hypothetical protein JW727_01980 [Candidatus Aenigmarchaeota archaeon]|nr:hypothetical protein [Candidatus Aenigmarchaeota archaeon]